MTDPTGTVGENVATFASLGVVVGVVLLIICSIIIAIFVVQRKRKQQTFRYIRVLFQKQHVFVDIRNSKIVDHLHIVSTN